MSDRSVGVVLTGGRSSRMGPDKAVLVVDGKPLAVRVADALWEAGCHPVECQGGSPDVLAALGLTGFEDRSPGGGPLDAIVTALQRHPDEAVVVAACDLVDLDAATVAAVNDAPNDAEVTVARAGGRRHLLARFAPGTADAVDELRTRGVDSFLEALGALQADDVEVDQAAVRNLNTPDDLDTRGSLDTI